MEDKPMSIKERMALLAKAQNSPTPAAPRVSPKPAGKGAIADRIAQLSEAKLEQPMPSPVRESSATSSSSGAVPPSPAAADDAGTNFDEPKGATAKAGRDGHERPLSGGIKDLQARLAGGMGGRALPLPGMSPVMPRGGLKQPLPPGAAEELQAVESPKDASASASKSSSSAESEAAPGELQHAALARATMPQKRRPRRVFKAAEAAPEPETPSIETTTPAEQREGSGEDGAEQAKESEAAAAPVSAEVEKTPASEEAAAAPPADEDGADSEPVEAKEGADVTS